MSLQDEINRRIKDEIEKDPEGIGYAGKTDEEIQVLLNTPVIKTRVVEEQSAPPISRILVGLESAPNIVAKTDVSTAKLFVAEEVIE